MAAGKRMKASKRKQAIVEAARPLFAQNGFHGTSVRDIARAADVSEALLYRHFVSKEALYDEVLDYAGTVSATAFDELQDMEPGAETLVVQIYFLVRLILFEVPRLKNQQHWHERLLFRSLLGDAKYARNHFANLQRIMDKRINVCFEAAARAGEVTIDPAENRDNMWFVHHLAMALNLCHMSGKPAFEYEMSKDEMAERAVLFCLRGLGMTESAINQHFRSRKLKTMFKSIYRGENSQR